MRLSPEDQNDQSGFPRHVSSHKAPTWLHTEIPRSALAGSFPTAGQGRLRANRRTANRIARLLVDIDRPHSQRGDRTPLARELLWGTPGLLPAAISSSPGRMTAEIPMQYQISPKA